MWLLQNTWQLHGTCLTALFSRTTQVSLCQNVSNLHSGFYCSQGWRRWWWQLELRVQSLSQIITTTKPIPSFLQARCPLCRPINSVKATNKENKYHLHKLAHPSWPGVFQPCVWPPNAPDYFVRGHQAFHQPSDDSSLDYLRKFVYIFMWPSILQFTYIFACNDCYKPKERL